MKPENTSIKLMTEPNQAIKKEACGLELYNVAKIQGMNNIKNLKFNYFFSLKLFQTY